MKKFAFKPGGISTIVKALIVTGSIFLLAAVYALATTHKVSANTPDVANVHTKYPNMVGTRIDTCSLCHTPSIPGLNPYGAAYKAAGRSLAALGAIESADSDGDGFSNLQEITALTFPGDPSDFPQPTRTPTPTRTPVPTSTPTSPPSPTPTNTPTATSVGNPTPTSTSVPSATPLPSMTPAPSGTPTIGPSPTPTPTCTGDHCEKHRHRHHRHRRFRRHRHPR